MINDNADQCRSSHYWILSNRTLISFSLPVNFSFLYIPISLDINFEITSFFCALNASAICKITETSQHSSVFFLFEKIQANKSKTWWVNFYWFSSENAASADRFHIIDFVGDCIWSATKEAKRKCGVYWSIHGNLTTIFADRSRMQNTLVCKDSNCSKVGSANGLRELLRANSLSFMAKKKAQSIHWKICGWFYQYEPMHFT